MTTSLANFGLGLHRSIKKSIAVILLVVMVISIVPLAFAEQGDERGRSDVRVNSRMAIREFTRTSLRPRSSPCSAKARGTILITITTKRITAILFLMLLWSPRPKFAKLVVMFTHLIGLFYF